MTIAKTGWCPMVGGYKTAQYKGVNTT